MEPSGCRVLLSVIGFFPSHSLRLYPGRVEHLADLFCIGDQIFPYCFLKIKIKMTNRSDHKKSDRDRSASNKTYGSPGCEIWTLYYMLQMVGGGGANK